MAPTRTNANFSNYVLLRKPSNIENFPPRSMRQASLSMKGAQVVNPSTVKFAARRRRHRAAQGLYPTQHAVEEAARRHRCVSRSSAPDVEMADASSAALSSPTTTFNLPRVLERPAFKEVSRQRLAAIEPGLASAPLDYIQDGLKVVSETMLKVLRGIRIPSSGSSALPREINVAVDDLSRDMPTHMLAVWSRSPSQSATRVTLYPTHQLVLAAHCATLPVLPPSRPAPPAAAGETISVPVVPLGLPHAASFPRLHTFLYNKDADELLAALLPCAPPARVSGESDAAQYKRFAAQLAGTYTAQALLGYALGVNGLWRNACALGVFDRTLWRIIDIAWAVLTAALAISTGQESQVFAPRK